MPQTSLPQGLPLARRQPVRKRRRWLRSLRYYYHRLVRMRGTPEAIARGLAIGVFAGWFPWFGFQIVVAIALATLLRGNRMVAAAATWVSNPFTYVPIFAFNFHIGQRLLGSQLDSVQLHHLTSWKAVTELGGDFLVPLFFGCLVVGAVLAIKSYLVSRWLIGQARQRRTLRKPPTVR